MHQSVTLLLSSAVLSAKEVGVASALICRGISALRMPCPWLFSVVHTSLNSYFDRSTPSICSVTSITAPVPTS